MFDRGEVEVILEQFEVTRFPIYAVLPPTKTPLAKARLFADLLVERLKRERL